VILSQDNQSFGDTVEGLAIRDKDVDDSYVKLLQKKTLEEWVDDDEKAVKEEEALKESSLYFLDITHEENQWLSKMQSIADQRSEVEDSKVKALIGWIKQKLIKDGKWTDERLLVFTEYRDTLEYLERIFKNHGWDDRYLQLKGGMYAKDRERIKQAFLKDPKENSIRILLATDAASEGLNLQNHCRYLIHYEIPWNPNRMEQRNGRIDRVGQDRDITVHHFTYNDNEDSEYLNTVVDKVKQMREDIGSIGEIISKQVEEKMLGLSPDRQLELNKATHEKIRIIREENKAERVTKEKIRELRLKREKTGTTLDITPDNIKNVLEVALSLSGGSLEHITTGPLAGKGCRLGSLPNDWRHMKHHFYTENTKHILVFDHDYQREKHTVLVHLNHPLFHKATNIFREQIWKSDIIGSKKVYRCSYKVVKDRTIPKLHMITFGRLIATNSKGIKLHEDLLLMGGEVEKEKIFPSEQSSLWNIFNMEGDYPPIPIRLGDQLRSLFSDHKQEIRKIMEHLLEQKRDEIQKVLTEKAKSEEQHVRELMQERLNEIEIRKKKLELQKGPIQMKLLDFTDEENEQWEDDIRRMEVKFNELQKNMEQEPERVKERYTLKNFEIYPLATLYVIPEHLLEV